MSRLIESLLTQPESSQVHRCNGRIYDRNEDGDLDITDHTRLVSSLYHRKQETYSENKIFSYVTLDHLREDLIAKARKVYGNQDPKLEEGDIFRITIKLPKSENQPAPNSIPESELGVESKMTLQILALLKKAPMVKSEIAKALGKEKPTRYLNDLMKKMITNQQVAYTIPDKPNSRLQKYRLTDKGKNFGDDK